MHRQEVTTGLGVTPFSLSSAGERTAAALVAWIVLEDEAGFAMTPPAPTRGRRGQTPVVRARGRSRRRISVAAPCCYRPGDGFG
ncbi:hypothetical protein SGFS_008040 [Streptomyces graminofaciens]|uniref:Uncharacterized protein n=1 Tax=Streptomyces graminofaciens TaxID=68212 RepID=A0ABM7F1A8_9ACTN|nr:hypothetical protein SGFS_008040 [Streptomyces graminofaciens]